MMSNVASAADMIRFPDLYAKGVESTQNDSCAALYIGDMHNQIPFFLNLKPLMNPHIFICGVTGSGKTCLMKNLVLKLKASSDSLIILIDITGEYAGFVELTGGIRAEMSDKTGLLKPGLSGILCFDLKEIGDEAAKVGAAEEVLDLVLENMRKESSGRNVFVVLDEAWKLLGKSRSLQTMLREGRKYGHGLIFSSQLVEDVDFSMLSNAATLFIFRLQNKQTLSKLANNYNLGVRHVTLIQSLGVGSCAVIQTNATGGRSFYLIKKVHDLGMK